MTNKNDRTAICIVGDSRSGSSIFQGLIQLHKDATAVGELRRLEQFVAQGLPCSCGKPVGQCEHWQAVMQRAGLRADEIRSQPPRWKALRRVDEIVGFGGVALRLTGLTRHLFFDGAVAANHCARLLDAACEQAGARVVVDNSKDPGHAVYLLHQRIIPVHVAFIVRDGRATVWSKMRRTGISLEQATRHWARTTYAMLALSRVIGPQHSSWLRYEDLCADPRQMIGGFVERLGLDPRNFGGEQNELHHHIGGTPDFSGADFDAVREDKRWRSEIPVHNLTQFESIAGKLNRRLGYT